MSFSLRSLLVAFVVVASALGTFGPCGLVVGLLLVAGVVFFRTVRVTPIQCVVSLVIAGFVFAVLLWRALDLAKETARGPQCRNNLMQIALALHCYHDRNGSFPPAYVVGPDGKPWHSWRVLILPFLEEYALYKAYRFDEPWDGPNNRKLAASMPRVYACPLSDATRARSGATSYLAVVGPETAWPGAKGRRLFEIRDGPGRTILVMEAAGLGISWMEPRDLDFDQVTGQSMADPGMIGTIPHPHRADFFQVVEGGSLNVAFADGSVDTIPWGVPGRALAPLLTAQGGERGKAELVGSPYTARPDWPRVLSLAALVLSTLLLWWTARPARRGSPAPGEQSGGPLDTMGSAFDAVRHDAPD